MVFRVTPYYEDGAVTIYHGDSREMAWPIACERTAVITDPPYGTSYYASDTNVLDAAMLRQWIKVDDTVVAIFGWPERLVALSVAAQVVPDEWVTWWPTNGRNRGFNKTGLWREVECIAVFGKGIEWSRLRQPRTITTTPLPKAGLRGKPTTDQARMGDVWRDESPNLNPNQSPRLHPNEKPVGVMRRLVEAMTDRGDVVFDPFAGSGSTLLAAKQSHRIAIGIEIEERYCEIAAKRCSQEVIDLAV